MSRLSDERAGSGREGSEKRVTEAKWSAVLTERLSSPTTISKAPAPWHPGTVREHRPPSSAPPSPRTPGGSTLSLPLSLRLQDFPSSYALLLLKLGETLSQPTDPLQQLCRTALCHCPLPLGQASGMLLSLVVWLGSVAGNGWGVAALLRRKGSWASGLRGLPGPQRFALLGHGLGGASLLTQSVVLVLSCVELGEARRAMALAVPSSLGVSLFGVGALQLLLSAQVETLEGGVSVGTYAWLLGLVGGCICVLLSIYQAMIIERNPEGLELVSRIAFFSTLVSMIFFVLAAVALGAWHWRRYDLLRSKRLNQNQNAVPKVTPISSVKLCKSLTAQLQVFVTMVAEHRKFVRCFYTTILLSLLWLPYVIDLVSFIRPSICTSTPQATTTGNNTQNQSIIRRQVMDILIFHEDNPPMGR